eukprot:scaffold38150_cov33-Tisochrysis_lutea.AAC.1
MGKQQAKASEPKTGLSPTSPLVYPQPFRISTRKSPWSPFILLLVLSAFGGVLSRNAIEIGVILISRPSPLSSVAAPASIDVCLYMKSEGAFCGLPAGHPHENGAIGTRYSCLLADLVPLHPKDTTEFLGGLFEEAIYFRRLVHILDHPCGAALHEAAANWLFSIHPLVGLKTVGEKRELRFVLGLSCSIPAEALWVLLNSLVGDVGAAVTAWRAESWPPRQQASRQAAGGH